MISSLDELALGCADENARTNIGEAIKCYQSGAYRAAIVNAYVAVCFDLIEKLKALADSGDGEAKTEERKLQQLQRQNDRSDPNAIKGLLEFERNLLELFRNKFDFFGKNEFDELNRLKEDRNRCAHPTFSRSSIPFSPSAELARLHIRNALVHVLTQHPRQGKAALESLENLVQLKYFPSKVPDAIERFKESELANARPALVNAFADSLCFNSVDKFSPMFKKNFVFIALEALIELHRSVALPRIGHNINKLLKRTDPDAIFIAGIFALRNPELAELINMSGKAVLNRWVEDPEIKVSRGNLVCLGLRIEWMRESITKVLATLNSAELGNIDYNKIPSEVIAHAAQMYGSARNWTEANKYASDFAIKFASKFSSDDLEFVLTEISEGRADLADSHGFTQFLDALFDESSEKKNRVCVLLKENKLERYLPEEGTVN